MALGILTGFFAALLGWQINLVAIHRGLVRGWLAAFSVGLGATCADLIIIIAVLAGASTLLSVHPEIRWIAKWIGTATILLVSMRILFHKTAFKDDSETKNRNPTKNFAIGLLLVLGNPAIYLLWIGVVGFMVTHLQGLGHPLKKILFLGGFLGGAVTWFFLLSLLVLPRIRAWGENRLHWISRFSAAILLLAALVLVFEKF